MGILTMGKGRKNRRRNSEVTLGEDKTVRSSILVLALPWPRRSHSMTCCLLRATPHLISRFISGQMRMVLRPRIMLQVMFWRNIPRKHLTYLRFSPSIGLIRSTWSLSLHASSRELCSRTTLLRLSKTSSTMLTSFLNIRLFSRLGPTSSQMDWNISTRWTIF